MVLGSWYRSRDCLRDSHSDILHSSMIEGRDSAYPPTDAQIAAFKSQGVRFYWGYFAGPNILNGWPDDRFRALLAAGIGTGAFCSGWADPKARKIRGPQLKSPICLDYE